MGRRGEGKEERMIGGEEEGEGEAEGRPEEGSR